MKFEITKNGSGLVRINTDTYLLFNVDETVKHVLIHYPTAYGAESKIFTIELLKLPAQATRSIGAKNIKRIRSMVRERLEDGLLTSKSLIEMGETINSEGTT